jgi:hypothetical protein
VIILVAYVEPKIYQSLLDEKLIKRVFGMSINEVLSDKNAVLSLYMDLKDNINDKRTIDRPIGYDGLAKLKVDIIENYLLYINKKENISQFEADILKQYKKLYTGFTGLFKIHPECMVGSKIYKNWRGFFDIFESEKINGALDSMSKKALKIAYELTDKQIPDNRKPIPTDINYLMEFLINKLGTSNVGLRNLQDNIATLLLNTQKDYGIYSRIFLVNYFMHKYSVEEKCDDLLLYVSDGNLVTGNVYGKDYGITYGDSGIISLDYRFMNGPLRYENNVGISRDTMMLQVLFKQLAIFRQNYELYHTTKVNKTTFNEVKNILFDHYLSTPLLSEKILNIQHRESEVAAEVYGWENAYSCLNEYAPSRLKQLEISDTLSTVRSYEQSIGYQIDPNTNVQKPLELYNVQKLREIIKGHDGILANFPELSIFFTPDGNLKSLNELVSVYTNIALNNGKYLEYDVDLDVFNEFFISQFMERGISSYRQVNDINELVGWFSILITLFYEQCDKLKQMYLLRDNINMKDLKIYLDYHEKLFKNIKFYLENNSSTIRKLSNNEASMSFANFPLDEQALNRTFNETEGYLTELRALQRKEQSNYGF